MDAKVLQNEIIYLSLPFYDTLLPNENNSFSFYSLF